MTEARGSAIAAGRRIRQLGIALVLLASLAACGGKRPFLLVNLCLGDERGVAAFPRHLEKLARAESMAFIDGSEATRRDLNRLDPTGRSHSLTRKTIHIGVERRDGFGLTAGNLGLSPYQVAVGFSEGPDPVAARRFAERAVAGFEKIGRVETVAGGMGAMPMQGCG